jgi:hypothetical protein
MRRAGFVYTAGVESVYPTMSVLCHRLGFLALVAALSLPCVAQTTPRPRAHGKDVRTGVSRKGLTPKPAESQRPEPAVAAPVSTPPPPSRPYELAPVAPQVTYTGGQLTISANNSTLADILNAVKSRTGAKVDLPSSAAQERVAVQLGPGNPRDVLAQLLHGSPFDYILLGSDQDPSAVTQIMLTRREGGGAAVASGNIPNRAPVQPEPADEDAADNEPPQPGPPQPTPGLPGQMRIGPPGMQQAPEQNAPAALPAPGAPVQPGQENQVKTPEQLLLELQRMQQQDQQRRQRPPR